MHGHLWRKRAADVPNCGLVPEPSNRDAVRDRAPLPRARGPSDGAAAAGSACVRAVRDAAADAEREDGDLSA